MYINPSVHKTQGPRPEALEKNSSPNSVTGPVTGDKVHEKLDYQNMGSPARSPNQLITELEETLVFWLWLSGPSQLLHIHWTGAEGKCQTGGLSCFQDVFGKQEKTGAGESRSSGGEGTDQ